MANNRVYTTRCVMNVNGAGNDFSQFQIFTQRRTLKIKSIKLDCRILRATVAGDQYYNKNNYPTDQFFGLAISSFVAPFVHFGSVFEQVAGVAILDTGLNLNMTTAGEWYFDSFYVSELLPLTIGVTNVGLDNLTWEFSLSIETEEKIIYN